MHRFFLTWLIFFLGWSLPAQIIGYVDSVEVHRTDTIYFGFGSAKLSPEAITTVQSLVADRPGDLELYLEGHTDAVGSDVANDELARRRSQQTLAAALAAGWPGEAVEIRYFGEQRLAVNSNQKEWRNRRVLLRSGLPKRYALFRGRVVDEEGLPLAGGIVAASRYLEDTVRANADGYYVIPLPLDIGIKLDVYAAGHFYSSETLVLREDKPAPTMVHTLKAAKVGSKLAIKDLHFVGNKTELLKESIPVLPRLLQFMRSSPELSIEIAGHVNKPGPRRDEGTWEYLLATNRAKLIYDYLTHFGIPKERMLFKGYSNYEMVKPEARTEEEMRANRRVEIRIVDNGEDME
jgi:outer membrane protein OmpA-like peptidoglycan-associated protein